jgi:hypothetical protein
MSGKDRATWADLIRESRKIFSAPAPKPTTPAPVKQPAPTPKPAVKAAPVRQAPTPKPAQTQAGLAADASVAYFRTRRNHSAADEKRYQDAVTKANLVNGRK